MTNSSEQFIIDLNLEHLEKRINHRIIQGKEEEIEILENRDGKLKIYNINLSNCKNSIDKFKSNAEKSSQYELTLITKDKYIQKNI